MLYDPRHDKTPSFSGFALFVATKNPQECYNWSNCMECAVGQYLASIDVVPHSVRWVGDIDIANMLARGSEHLRKEEWTFGKLADRILEYQKAH